MSNFGTDREETVVQKKKHKKYVYKNLLNNTVVVRCYIFYLLLTLFFPRLYYLSKFDSFIYLKVSPPLYAFEKNRIESPPIGFSNGKTVMRCEAEIYKYDCIYHFYDQVKTVVAEPLIVGLDKPIYYDIFAPIASRYCEKLNIYHFKNAYVKHKTLIILSNGDYFKIFHNNWRWYPGSPEKGKIITKYGYRVLFFIPVVYPQFYSHWITDGLAGIVLMPSWFWDINPTILTVVNSEYVHYSLELVGLGHVNVVNTDNYVYGDDVFVAHANELWNCMGVYAAKLIKQKYRAAFGLDKIEPVNYRFIGKDNNNRRFTNLNEIIELANIRTGKNWSLITKFTERVSFAREFASCLVLVISAGSQPYNCIYMRDGTGIVSLCNGHIDSPQFTYCYNINIWNIGVVHLDMKLTNHSMPANVNLTLDTIEKMIYTVAHQHYPPGIDMFQPFCISDAKKVYFEYGDQKFLGSDEIGKQRLIDFLNRTR